MDGPTGLIVGYYCIRGRYGQSYFVEEKKAFAAEFYSIEFERIFYGIYSEVDLNKLLDKERIGITLKQEDGKFCHIKKVSKLVIRTPTLEEYNDWMKKAEGADPITQEQIEAKKKEEEKAAKELNEEMEDR